MRLQVLDSTMYECTVPLDPLALIWGTTAGDQAGNSSRPLRVYLKMRSDVASYNSRDLREHDLWIELCSKSGSVTCAQYTTTVQSYFNFRMPWSDLFRLRARGCPQTP